MPERLYRRYPRDRTLRPQLTSSEMCTDRLCGLDNPLRAVQESNDGDGSRVCLIRVRDRGTHGV